MFKTIVYLVHGPDKFYAQARLSILTLLDLLFKQRRDDYQVVVYCDRPALVPQHPFVRLVHLSAARLAEWRRPTGYVHRVKIAVLRAVAAHSPGPFVLVDSDTRWLRLPNLEFDELIPVRGGGPTVFFMHALENDISPTYYRDYHRYLRRRAATDLARWSLRPGPWRVWNSGVVGVAPAVGPSFFDEALDLCDRLYLNVRPRLYVEQVAIALLADRQFQLRPFGECVHHYWQYTAEAPAYLDRLFADLNPAWPIERQADYCGRLAWDEAELRAMQTVPAHRFRCWFAKQRNSIFKRAQDLKAIRLRFAQRLAAGRR